MRERSRKGPREAGGCLGEQGIARQSSGPESEERAAGEAQVDLHPQPTYLCRVSDKSCPTPHRQPWGAIPMSPPQLEARAVSSEAPLSRRASWCGACYVPHHFWGVASGAC